MCSNVVFKPMPLLVLASPPCVSVGRPRTVRLPGAATRQRPPPQLPPAPHPCPHAHTTKQKGSATRNLNTHNTAARS
jgi:hypothetical protein